MSGVILLQPGAVFADPNQQTVQTNATLTASGSAIFTGYGAAEVSLFINVKASPTGTTPTLQYTIQEVDPGDGATVIGNIATSTVINAIGIQRITLESAFGGSIKVVWTVTGAGASFTQVYTTLVAKQASVKITDGTNLMPTADVAARALFEKVTDGTNTAAVKAASTAAVAADPALVVAVSPNNLLQTQGVDRTATGNITANGQTVAVSGVGAGNVGVYISGTWVATLQFEGTIDGTNWFVMDAFPIGSSTASVQSTTANGQWRLVSGGSAQIRVRCSAFTSGTATVTLEASPATGLVRATQGTPTASPANAWLDKITDGTNIAAVKAASTAAVAADPALVVAISPNGTITVTGGKTNNNAAPGATNFGTLPALANAAAPTWTEGNQVALSALLNGSLRTDNTSWLGSTAPTVGSKTGAASIPVVIASDQGTLTVQGGKTNNNAAPGATNIGTLPVLANAANPTWTEGNQVALSANLSGALRVTQNAAGTLANWWGVRVTDGTNAMPTMDTAARRGFLSITDGTNTAAVKAASTAAVAADPALVVAVSPNNTVTTQAARSATGTSSNVASSITNVTLLASNANRLGATIFNDGSANLFIKLGATASATSFTVRVTSQGYYEVPFGYTGQIDGIWSVANGSARITELT